MKERLLEACGRGVPAEFTSVWNKEQSLKRLEELLHPNHSGRTNDALAGHVVQDEVVLMAPLEENRRASGDRFSGQLLVDAKGVRLVGEFRVSTFNVMITILFAGPMLVFSVFSVGFGLVGLVSQTMSIPDALGTIFLLPLPALVLALIVMWWQSLSRRELVLISGAIKNALSHS